MDWVNEWSRLGWRGLSGGEWEIDHAALGVGEESGGEDFVTGDGFVWGGATEATIEEALAFGDEGGPHLLEGVAKTGFEDAAGDGGESVGGEADIVAFPGLFGLAAEDVEGFGFFGGETDSAFCAEDFDEPGIHFVGGEAFGGEVKGDGLTSDEGIGMDEGIIPSVAGGLDAEGIWAGVIDFLELGVEGEGFPAEAEREVSGVEAEVAHDADLATELVLAFPVERFGGIEIGRVPEAGADFEEVTEVMGAEELVGFLGGGEEGEFGGAANEATEFEGEVADGFGGFEIDTERFFGEEIFSCEEDIGVDGEVKMMRDSDIDEVEIGLEEFVVISGE